MNRFTVCGESKAEITVERSRFLAVAAGVTDEKTGGGVRRGRRKRGFMTRRTTAMRFSAGGTKRFFRRRRTVGHGGKPILNVIEQRSLSTPRWL